MINRGGTTCFFASDLHGREDRYRSLFSAIAEDRPEAVLLGGDLFPHHWLSVPTGGEFLADFLVPELERLRRSFGSDMPALFVILGNDDKRVGEAAVRAVDDDGLWRYVHERWVSCGDCPLLGYAYVPPTPFLLKDWEKYDVSRFTEHGSVSPEAGTRTVEVDPDEIRFGSIAADLERLTAGRDLDRSILLFHSPPYRTALDRAALDGRTVDNAPLDVHVGSVAIRRFIEDRQPMLTLHGHIHESARLTGTWREQIGRTLCMSAAHDGPELALVRFTTGDVASATRELR